MEKEQIENDPQGEDAEQDQTALVGISVGISF